jgi:hypothetical protein
MKFMQDDFSCSSVLKDFQSGFGNKGHRALIHRMNVLPFARLGR